MYYYNFVVFFFFFFICEFFVVVVARNRNELSHRVYLWFLIRLFVPMSAMRACMWVLCACLCSIVWVWLRRGYCYCCFDCDGTGDMPSVTGHSSIVQYILQLTLRALMPYFAVPIFFSVKDLARTCVLLSAAPTKKPNNTVFFRNNSAFSTVSCAYTTIVFSVIGYFLLFSLCYTSGLLRPPDYYELSLVWQPAINDELAQKRLFLNNGKLKWFSEKENNNF